MMDDMGVFISCDTVDMKLVFAESSSLYRVILFRIIKLPMNSRSVFPIGVI